MNEGQRKDTIAQVILLYSELSPHLNMSLGSNGSDGKLTFHFNAKSPTWANTNYQTMLTHLKKQITAKGGTVNYIECVISFRS